MFLFLINMNKLNPNWIVGFVDGNGHFDVSNDQKTFHFVLSQNLKSVNILYTIKRFFKCGSVSNEIPGTNVREYRVSSKKHLENIIVPFFQKWPLKTSKKKSFEIFIKKLNPTLYLESVENSNFNLHWFIGFVDAKGCFICSIIRTNIRPQFFISLKEVDKNILDQIKQNLNLGIRYKQKNGIEVFQLSSNENMYYFAKHVLLTKGYKDRLKTYKRIQARKWCKIVLLMKQKKHKTIDGFNKIQKLNRSF